MIGFRAGKHRRSTRHAWSAAACALMLALGGSGARANDAETIAAARAIAVEGVKLARAGDCQRAVEPLTRAEALHHSSIVLMELGACQVQLGRLVAGSEALRRVVRESLPDSPSAAQRDALSQAERMLAQVLPKIAQLSVVVAGPDAAEVALSIDGQAVPRALLGVARPTDPGRHQVAASAPGFLPTQREVELSEGERSRLEVELTPAPAPVAAASAAQSDEPSDRGSVDTQRELAGQRPTAASERTGLRRAAYVSWSLGAAGLAAGVVFGGLAWSDKRQLEQRCDGNLCSEAARSEIVRAKRWGLASTIGVAAGATWVVAGSIAYAVARRRERRPEVVWSAGLTLTGGTARVQF